jgi:peptidoglycan/xylan/chitin deacetylase (PgdA/CDA1 family)
MSDVLILCYHAVSKDWPTAISVTPAALESQLTYLVRRGYRGLRFHEAVIKPPAVKTVVVTFDDAYRSVLELALPILDRLGLPGTVFVPTRFASGGQLASWPGVDVYLDGPHARELAVMSWEELSNLSSHGWEIGSHTRSHPRLTQLEDQDLLEELVGSREDCEHRLGIPCHSVAFPYGDTDARVVATTCASGYTAAAGLPHFRSLHQPAALNWPRIGIFYGDGTGRFRLKASPTSRRLQTFVSRISSSSPRTSIV